MHQPGLQRPGCCRASLVTNPRRCLKKAHDAFFFDGPAKFSVSSFVRCEERVLHRSKRRDWRKEEDRMRKRASYIKKYGPLKPDRECIEPARSLRDNVTEGGEGPQSARV
jgi:hypothetical protein